MEKRDRNHDVLEINSYPFEQAARDFAQPWQALLDEVGTEPSIAPQWLRSIVEAQGIADQLQVLVGTRGGQVTSILPYLDHTVRMLGISLRMWELPGDRIVAYHQPFLSLEPDTGLLRAVLCRPSAPWDVLLAPCLRDGTTAQALRELCAERGWILLSFPGDSSPYFLISGSWEDYLAAQSANFRYNLKRKERALHKAGRVTERWFNEPGDVAALGDIILDIEAHSWKVGAGMSIAASDLERRYYQSLLPFLAQSGALFANVLYLDDKPVAYNLCYLVKGRVAQIKTSFNEAASSLSPGLVVNYYAIRRAFAAGATEFDFLGDIMPHKSHWTDRVRRHENYYVFSRRPQAQLVGHLKRCSIKLRGQRAPVTLGRGAQR